MAVPAHTPGQDAGRPRRPGTFLPGDDPRRNKGGRRPSRATAALQQAITDGDLTAMWRAGLEAAKAGDPKWAALIAAYLDGKPVARNENGDPGSFDLDLSDVESNQLRAALKAVK